jgi:RNA polymerase sigma-70 factor (ECF subfamily)
VARALTVENPVPLCELASLSDLQLVDGVLLRHEDALAEIYHRYGSPVAAAARMVLGNSSASEDVVAEVFLAFWLKPTSFEPERGSLLGFFRMRVRGRSIDFVRSEVARRRREENEAFARGRHRADQDDDFLSTELAEQIRKALASLVQTEREAIELAFFSQMTYRAVAEYLELPEGTVKSRIRTGLRNVRVALESELLAQAGSQQSLPASRERQ